MSDIEVGYVSYTVSADYFATLGADFDSEAIDDAVLKELNAVAPFGVTVHRNGKVFADESRADEARAINWTPLLEQIDLEQIVATHGK